MKYLKSKATLSVLLTTSVILASSLNVLAQVPDLSILKSQERIQISLNGRETQLTLNAENKNTPPLNINLKRTIRLIESDLQRKEFESQSSVDLATISMAFAKKGIQIKSYDDLFIVKNFANGVKEISADQIFKKSMSEDLNSNFWYAIMPKSVAVERIRVQRDWFSTGTGAHGQIRFNLNSPILLVPQEAKVTNLSVNDLTNESDWKNVFAANPSQLHLIKGDVTYSLYALRYKNGPADWSFTTGMSGAFANAYTLSSTPHNVVYLAHADFVEQHDLVNPFGQGTEVFKSALARANKYRESRIYHLIFSSCISELNRSLNAEGKGYPVKSYGVNSSDFNPYTFVEKLKPALSPIISPSLNIEFGSPVTTKAESADVTKHKAKITSAEFEKAVINLAYEAIDLNYQDLKNIEKTIGELKKLVADGKIGSLEKINSPAELVRIMAINGLSTNLKQVKILFKLATNSDFMSAISALTIKGVTERVNKD